MTKKWTCVTVEIDAGVVEELSSEVAERFETGVEVTETGFRLYLEEESDAGSWQSILSEAVQAVRARSPRPFREPVTRVATVPEEDWAANWKAHFRPMRVGKRLLITPTWESPKALDGDLVLRIDPGRAFGTGHHETTRLCLEWIENLATPSEQGSPRSLLDVGTGSGILAMAAVLFGLETALGVDHDPEAIEVALENIRCNGLEGRVRLVNGETSELDEHFDVVVANIQAGPLIALADGILQRLAPGGRVALSGVLVHQAEEVRQVYESKGLSFEELRTDGEWCLLTFHDRNHDQKRISQ